MAVASVDEPKNTLSQSDVDDFNAALSLVMVASSLDEPASVDDAIHLRAVCRIAAEKLCQIRNRLSPESVEVQP